MSRKATLTLVHPTIPHYLAGVTVEVKEITPEFAKELLDRLQTDKRRNRNFRRSNAEAIQRVMEADLFKFNGESVVIDRDGFPIQGQHRLWACWKSNKPFWTVFVNGVDPDAKVTLDTCAKRKNSDVLTYSNEVRATVLASAINWLWRYRSGASLSNQGSVNAQEMLALLNENPGLRASVEATQPLAGITHHSVAAWCHYEFGLVDATARDSFFESLIDGAGLSKGSPVLALRNRLYSMKRSDLFVRNAHVVVLFIHAWNAMRQGKRVKSLGSGHKLSGAIPVIF
ncbi:hypothetical protein [Magnetospirillum molischianum]|uniref:ParB/Sulfiredoxin domain-containing protein n=1 Tax=Magnetospirillum molischianum DSM 120 TaxID=1150626 RepID=H8FXY7_MAGML|nr:hypothetical protein [Magnetospirillum molischianum]CCG43225.1 conserved hypothetical protein [Magnetospirillum molischianum DSM 120]